MNHKFVPNQLDKTKCAYDLYGAACARDIIAHTSLAKCESCGATGNIEVYETNRDIAICWNCKDKQLGELLEKTEASAIEQRKRNQLAREIESQNLAGLKFSGDLFNLKLQTFQEMALSIQNDETIPIEQKETAFQKLVSDRIVYINERCFTIDEEKRQLETEKLAAGNALRAYGGKLRDEIREKIKASDTTYQPIINAEAIKKSLKSKAKKSPFEIMIETIALNTGKPIEQVRAEVMKNPDLMKARKS